MKRSKRGAEEANYDIEKFFILLILRSLSKQVIDETHFLCSSVNPVSCVYGGIIMNNSHKLIDMCTSVLSFIATTTSAAFLACSIFTPASASILTFDGIGVNGTAIPDDYGDRITSTLDSGTGYEYGMGNGFTPNITVGCFPDPPVTAPYSLFTNGYGDLIKALGHVSYHAPGQIVLTPDPGYNVILNSFDIAGYGSSNYLAQRVRVLTESGSELFDSGLFDINSGSPSSSHMTFLSTPITTSEALHIEINELGSLGLDNVNFDQSIVPLPAAVWLFGGGLFGLVFVARRNKAA